MVSGWRSRLGEGDTITEEAEDYQKDQASCVHLRHNTHENTSSLNEIIILINGR